MKKQSVLAKGLEGVIVDETAISNVEGAIGRLSYRGYAIEDLITTSSFAEVVWLILFGELPSEDQAYTFEQFLLANCRLNTHERKMLEALPDTLHPMLALQSLMPALASDAIGDFDAPLHADEAIAGTTLAAKVPAIIAALYRRRRGETMLETDHSLQYHENFLFLFHGKRPAQLHIDTLNVTQILQAEHSFNASAFACRVTASTLAPVQSALSSAIGTLYGKLHGGADQAAVEMATAIGDPQNAAAYVSSAIKSKTKIMGMGHREYKVLDPRATILKPMAEKLCVRTPHEALYRTLEAVEHEVRLVMADRDKDIWANVEFYKGAVFYALGIPPEFFTSMFVMARVFGYLAHFLESRTNNRMIRPQAFYVGASQRKVT